MSLENQFLDHASSDDSDHDDGYDSEAAEVQKGSGRTQTAPRVKRRKLSHSSEESVDELAGKTDLRKATSVRLGGEGRIEPADDDDYGAQVISRSKELTDHVDADSDESDFKIKSAAASIKKISSSIKKPDKATKPGVVYLSSLPPYLKPSALRNLLQQRGFEPINRLFLTPASKAKSTSKKNSRQLYTEGWVEFGSKKTARRCAETLNANIVGGKKGGFYYDDLWNMKYLKGMAWDELMAGIREERREEEGRRDEERRTIAQETQRFLEGVEEGKRVEGMKRKRKAKEKGNNGATQPDDIKRTWRQFEVQGSGRAKSKGRDKMGDEVQAVLGKIF